jgi:hypothetical protein
MRKDQYMSTYEERVRRIRDVSAEVSGGKPAPGSEADIEEIKTAMTDLKLRAFHAGVKDAVKEWLEQNKTEVMKAISDSI